MRAAIRHFICGISVFILTGASSYIFLWHLRGLDRLSPEDGLAAAVGAMWCLCWGFVIGLLAAVLVVVFSILRTRRQNIRQTSG
jgi:hypothetical protein